MNQQNREMIFKAELEKLKENNYINDIDYEKVAQAYEKYSTSIIELKKEEENRLAELRLKREEEKQKFIEEQKEEERIRKEMKKKTPEQIRERNISLSLIAGVILFLLGGLILATSSWEKMNHLSKVASIGFVSLLFFGISYAASKYLKIEKTAFAFLTLASLLIPVTFIGIGFFQLFGEWLSLYGEGRYVLGLVTTLICIPLYTSIASRYKNRLFIWLSFLTVSAFISFLLAAFRLPIDFFYMGIMIYNGFLLAWYHFLKLNKKYDVFIRELPLYSQVSLVISTIFMLVLFQNYVVYSLNILLTAVMYLAIIFVYNKKEFHYVFTLLFVYGMYQLFQLSFLEPFNYLGFALVGIGYLLIDDRITNDQLKNVFRWTSGVVSGLAFLYISLEGFILRADNNSIVLLLSYLIVATNYLYLAFITKRNVFRYLAPIFLVVTGLQSYHVLSSRLHLDMMEIYMFVVGAVMFFLLYVKNKHPFIKPIQQSSFLVSLGTMLLSLLSLYYQGEYLHFSFLLGMFGFVIVTIYEVHPKYKDIAAWMLPIVWLFAIDFVYHQYAFMDYFYMNEVGMVGHFAISSLIIFGLSYAIRKYREPLFFPMFFVAIICYTLSLLATISTNMMSVIQTSFYLIGIVLYVVFVYQTKNHRYWVFVSITTAVFFLSLIELFSLYDSYTILVFSLLVVPILLLLIHEFVGRKVQSLQPYFFWTAHSFLAIFGVFSLGLYALSSFFPLPFLLSLMIYSYSVWKSEKEWQIRLFLYLGLSMIPVNLILLSHFYPITISLERLLTLSFFFFGLIWIYFGSLWKKRLEHYMLPFGIGTLVSFVVFQSVGFIELGLIILSAAMTIFLFRKRKWDLISIIPLFLAGVNVYDFTRLLDKPIRMLALASFVVLLFFIGKLLYAKLYHFEADWKKSNIDWFTVFAMIFLVLLDGITSSVDPLWVRILPSMMIVYLLYSQRIRVDGKMIRNVVITLTGLSVLLPYYIVVDHLNIPAVFAMEVDVLPFVALTIFLSKKAWSEYMNTMRVIQAIVLVVTATLIMSDALKSNLIYDAIIVGGLSLVSIWAGMHYRIKSYFFVGLAVLLLNVFLQTRPFWGNLPWWIYLIIGGATLIGFASFYEWQKQRPAKDGKTILQEKKEKLLQSFKDWE